MPPISAPTTGVSKIDHDGARIGPLFAGFESGSGRHGFSVFHRRERYDRPYPRYNREKSPTVPALCSKKNSRPASSMARPAK
jgi:hypothetical protein